MHSATQAKLYSDGEVEWVRTTPEEVLFKTRLTVASYQGPLKNGSVFLFFFSEWHKKKKLPTASQLPSWCIYRLRILFLMWRMWHICSHLHSVQCAFSGHSRVPAGETSSLAVIPADTRAQGISHIPFKDTLWYKNGGIVQGSQWRPVKLTAAEVSDVFTWVTTFSQLYVEWLLLWKHAWLLCNSGPHDWCSRSHMLPLWCQLSQTLTSVLVKSFLGHLLRYKKT